MKTYNDQKNKKCAIPDKSTFSDFSFNATE